jgi:hypothetical protein
MKTPRFRARRFRFLMRADPPAFAGGARRFFSTAR